MRLIHKFILLGFTLLILTTLALLPTWLIVAADQIEGVPASESISDVRIQPQATITFTPVATLYLPLVQRVETVETGPAPGAFEVRIEWIEYDPTTGTDVEGEYVDIRNFGASPIDLTDWTLRDAATNPNTFTFPAFSLDAGAEVRVWVKDGVADAANLYWGRGSAVWNNSGDTATLSDPSNIEIDSCSYPGGAPGFFDCEP